MADIINISYRIIFTSKTGQLNHNKKEVNRFLICMAATPLYESAVAQKHIISCRCFILPVDNINAPPAQRLMR